MALFEPHIHPDAVPSKEYTMPNDDPKEHPTLEMPKVVVPESGLNAIMSELRAMRAETTGRLDNIEANVEMLVTDQRDTKARLIRVETRMDQYDERGTKHSGGLARITSNDEKQNAAIGQLVADVSELKSTQATQLDILTRLDAVAANPTLRRLAYALATAALTYLTAKGIVSR